MITIGAKLTEMYTWGLSNTIIETYFKGKQYQYPWLWKFTLIINSAVSEYLTLN